MTTDLVLRLLPVPLLLPVLLVVVMYLDPFHFS
jgi:hypothetical protein